MGNKRNRNKPRQDKPIFVLGWCHAGMVTGGFADSVLNTFMHDGMNDLGQLLSGGGGYISIRSSPRIAEARNQIVAHFLSTPDFDEASYLVMLDTDMTWEAHAIHGLVDAAEAHGFGIMGGLCFAASDLHERCYPTLYVMTGKDEFGNPELDRHAEIMDNMIMEVDATGAACIAIHRRLLEHMAQPYPQGFRTNKDGTKNPYPWFADGVYPGRQIGEDIAFCLRAKALRYRVGVHTGYEFGHLKTRSVGRAQYEEYRRKHDDSGGVDNADHEQPDPGRETAAS